MITAAIGIVEQIDVARSDRALEEFVDGLGREWQGSHVDRHMLGLGNKPSVGIAERSREIAARIQDLRVRCTQHDLAHLLDVGAQAVLNYREGNRIEGKAHLACFLKRMMPTPADRGETATMQCAIGTGQWPGPGSVTLSSCA